MVEAEHHPSEASIVYVIKDPFLEVGQAPLIGRKF